MVRQDDLKVQALALEQSPHNRRGSLNNVGEIRRLLVQAHPMGVDLAQVEDVVDQVRDVISVAVDHLQVFPDVRRNRLAAEVDGRLHHHLAHPENQVQGRAQLVANRRGELGLEVPRLLGRGDRALERGVLFLQPIVSLGEALDELHQLSLAHSQLLAQPRALGEIHPSPLGGNVNWTKPQPREM